MQRAKRSCAKPDVHHDPLSWSSRTPRVCDESVTLNDNPRYCTTAALPFLPTFVSPTSAPTQQAASPPPPPAMVATRRTTRRLVSSLALVAAFARSAVAAPADNTIEIVGNSGVSAQQVRQPTRLALRSAPGADEGARERPLRHDGDRRRARRSSRCSCRWILCVEERSSSIVGASQERGQSVRARQDYRPS